MQIPKSQRTETIPGGTNVVPMNVEAAAAPYRALGQVGGAVSDVGDMLRKRQEKLQADRDYLDAINAETELEDYTRGRKVEASQLTGKDALDIYPAYQKDIDDRIQQMSGKLSEGARVRFTQLANASRKSYLDSIATHVASQVKVFKKDSREAWLNGRTASVTENPLSFDRELEKGNAVIDATTSGPETALEKEKFYDVLRSAQLQSLVNSDPQLALQYISENREGIGKKLTDEFEQKAHTRQKQLDEEERTRQAELDKKLKAMEKAYHDGEKRSIGDMYLKGDYSAALRAVNNSKYLSGDEIRTWSDSIKREAKTTDKPVDPVAKAAEIVYLNRMERGGADPELIRNRIIMSPNLSPQDKEQYIGKYET